MAPVSYKCLKDYMDDKITEKTFMAKYSKRELAMCLKKLLRVYGTDDDLQITMTGRVIWQEYTVYNKKDIVDDIYGIVVSASNENIENRLR